MNISTMIIASIIIVTVVYNIVKMIKTYSNGCGCGCGSSHCRHEKCTYNESIRG